MTPKIPETVPKARNAETRKLRSFSASYYLHLYFY